MTAFLFFYLRACLFLSLPTLPPTPHPYTGPLTYCHSRQSSLRQQQQQRQQQHEDGRVSYLTLCYFSFSPILFSHRPPFR
ncbi:hypothetical protein E2C01_076811 [Portunus trituberculatus]|uniref:Secreted protein n=1 Tax=Portunus trituberculatus TaxID=210409 RepID=A0A5B7IPN6_PORTR|nr:hypothetical protein [Portunus trituberculatus]